MTIKSDQKPVKRTISEKRKILIKIIKNAKNEIAIKVSAYDSKVFNTRKIANLIYEKAQNGVKVEIFFLLVIDNYLTRKKIREHKLWQSTNFFWNYKIYVRDETKRDRPLMNFCLVDKKTAFYWIPIEVEILLKKSKD